MIKTNRIKLLDKEAADYRVKLEECVQAYHFAVNINVSYIDENGDVNFFFGKPPAFCTFRQALQDIGNSCSKAHMNGSRIAEQLGEEYIFSCPSGLIHFLAPIVKDRIFRGALVAGPILMDYADDTMLEQIITSSGLTVRDKGKIKVFLREIPIFEPTQVRHLAKLLFLVSCNATTKDGILQEKSQSSSQQAQIGLGIQAAKEKGLDFDCVPYEYEREKELLLKVKAGDVIGAKNILNDLLGIIFFYTGSNVEVIKARLLELCTLLSRAAVEKGAALDKIFGMNYRFISELSTLKSPEALSFWILKVLDTFTQNIFYMGDAKNIEIIQKAISYANANYNKETTLDAVAEHVHLNPSYFSTMFKKETGVGFSDYLNIVRIEKSKNLLRERQYSIMDVALMVGFEDRSYFSRVFRKVTGITPKEYRNK